jgi:hypothetical protein
MRRPAGSFSWRMICQGGECDLQCDAGEVLTDALMYAVAETKVSAGVSVDVEFFWVIDVFRIPVPGGKVHDQEVPGTDRLTTDGDTLAKIVEVKLLGRPPPVPEHHHGDSEDSDGGYYRLLNDANDVASVHFSASLSGFRVSNSERGCLAVEAIGHAAVVIRSTRAPTRALVGRHRNDGRDRKSDRAFGASRISPRYGR